MRTGRPVAKIELSAEVASILEGYTQRRKTAQGLALRFLIAAQDQRFLRWVEIEADHLPELRLKLLILGQFEGPREMRLNVVAAHRRCTLACEIPAARAIVRQLQRACIASGVTAFSKTTRTASGGKDGLRPRPGASSRPARRRARKRWHQSFTVTRDTPSRTAICACVMPAARSRIISALWRSRTAIVVARVRRAASGFRWGPAQSCCQP